MSGPFLAAAIEIGETLVASAIPGPGGCGWIGDDLAGLTPADAHVVTGPVGPDLYGGTIGIAWFLAHLARATDATRFAPTARAGARSALARAAAGDLGASLYSGTAGIALAALEVARALDDRELAAEAEALAGGVAETLKPGRADGDACDLIGGVAGTCLACLAIGRVTGQRRFLDAAAARCRILVERGTAAWWGTSWPVEPGAPGLCGLGHGASGIALALAETAWATGDAGLLDCARAAFAYERGRFSPERCAWPDLREPGAEAWTAAWCHGALGIGAVRLRFHEAMPEDWALAEASAALQSARTLAIQAGRDMAEGVAHDVTLCHGLGGVAELMFLAAEVLHAPAHRLAGQRVAEICLRVRAVNGGQWTNGLRGCRNVPGLMAGDAGIGIAMLRAHDGAAAGSPLLAGRPA
ncbi:MAG: lanthionine synthetase LanC family protein [Amaricoccus sp.]